MLARVLKQFLTDSFQDQTHNEEEKKSTGTGKALLTVVKPDCGRRNQLYGLPYRGVLTADGAGHADVGRLRSGTGFSKRFEEKLLYVRAHEGRSH